jgi:hypothetical protein
VAQISLARSSPYNRPIDPGPQTIPTSSIRDIPSIVVVCSLMDASIPGAKANYSREDSGFKGDFAGGRLSPVASLQSSADTKVDVS